MRQPLATNKHDQSHVCMRTAQHVARVGSVQFCLYHKIYIINSITTTESSIQKLMLLKLLLKFFLEQSFICFSNKVFVAHSSETQN